MNTAEIVQNRSLDRARNVARRVLSLIWRAVKQYFWFVANRCRQEWPLEGVLQKSGHLQAFALGRHPVAMGLHVVNKVRIFLQAAGFDQTAGNLCFRLISVS